MNFHKIERIKNINSNHDMNNNLIYQNIIYNIEKDIRLKSKNIVFPKDFLIMYNDYKITSRLILDNPNFFYDYHDIIQFEQNNEICLNEHHEKIFNYISFTNIFFKLIKFGFFNGYISAVQYKLVKIILKKVNNIWYSDYYLKKIYNKNNNKLPSVQELLFFYDIFEIIYYKIQINNTNTEIDYTMMNEKNLLNNNYYLNIINKEKMFYESQYKELTRKTIN
jgi:hypothetical protein